MIGRMNWIKKKAYLEKENEKSDVEAIREKRTRKLVKAIFMSFWVYGKTAKSSSVDIQNSIESIIAHGEELVIAI